MTETIFDVHAHYDDPKFDNDRDEILSSLPQHHVSYVINAGTNIATSQTTVDYCQRYDFMYGAVGIHPEDADNLPENYLSVIEQMTQQKKIVAVGEIGLDYYWDNVPRDIQKKIFIEQLLLAEKRHMPVIIHDRDAHGDTMDILRQYRPQGIMHCFSGSVEMCREIVRLGMSVSLGGVVTFKNARHSVEVAKYIPLERLMLETDAPYLSPVPFRGKRCDSSMIRFTAEKIAEIKEMPTDDLLRITRENAMKMFGIPK